MLNTKILLALFISFQLTFSAFEKARYDNYRVYEIFIESDAHVQLIKEIDSYPDGVRKLKS